MPINFLWQGDSLNAYKHITLDMVAAQTARAQALASSNYQIPSWKDLMVQEATNCDNNR
jgi:hypothetical protein